MKDKARLLLILELLHRNTDDEHFETTVSILDYLKEKGAEVDRKTLKDDMQLLEDMGFGITKEKSSPNKYRWDNKLFKPAELQMLTDAVLSSRFISKAKSKELVEKISKMASDNEAKQIKINMDCIGRLKVNNTESYHTINMVANSIKNRVLISFKYTEYNQNKEKVYRNYGKRYKVSPYKLYWNEDFYYMIGWDEKHQDVTVFRVDRMEGVNQLKGEYIEKPKGFNIDDYAEKYFQMYDGEEFMVELEVRNDLMKYIIDRFGIDVYTEIKTEKTFTVKTLVKLSPTFFGWVFQFAGRIKIVRLEGAVEEYFKMIRSQDSFE